MIRGEGGFGREGPAITAGMDSVESVEVVVPMEDTDESVEALRLMGGCIVGDLAGSSG